MAVTEQVLVVPGSVAALEAGERAGGAEPCANCGTPRHGAYCHACGQHFLEGRLTMRRLWGEIVSRIFILERGYFFTFGQMFVRPGVVARQYVAGRRRRYTNPLTYFIVAATVALLGFGLVEGQLLAYMEAEFETSMGQSEKMEQQFTQLYGADPAHRLAEGVVVQLKRFYTYASLLLCTFFALMLRFLFRRASVRYNVAESLVFALYTVGHMILLSAFLMPLGVRINLQLYSVVLNSVFALYCGWAALGFYEGRFRTAAVTVAAYVGAYLAYMMVFLLAALIATVYVMTTG